MDLLQSVILGLIQGTTEWLPISSTGHLRVAQYFFGLNVPLLFDVLLHFATLMVILVYFRVDIKNLLLSLLRRDFHSSSGRLILPIIVGSIPTGIIGVVFGNDLDAYFNSLPLLAGGFIVSGLFLFASKYGVEKKDSISIPVAVAIGVMQGLSIVPSISRSGFTIAFMLLLGIKREISFKFSFLLSIPAVVGALGLTLYQDYSAIEVAGIGAVEVVVAMAATIAISFLALKLLRKTVIAGKFYMFAFYCFIIGAVLLILNSMGF
ncbi:MAG: undecaprenyl-diphosphate phosphatase [Candidatus Bathyarchaeota archaeon]|nr:undecaprenyl-diphosphate phosphatase [Candidatus Bathyarchaeota archaeon]MDD4326237.1 undecaprenyl-diphosphate phosphatase [Candidatus Bathyarchaeota archaeon]MDT8782065.1 undecaprenyl-diphosphate phosphatase [Candidatus Bathyarchaeota archaeon]